MNSFSTLLIICAALYMSETHKLIQFLITLDYTKNDLYYFFYNLLLDDFYIERCLYRLWLYASSFRSSVLVLCILIFALKLNRAIDRLSHKFKTD
jgi:hypothetical protein